MGTNKDMRGESVTQLSCKDVAPNSIPTGRDENAFCYCGNVEKRMRETAASVLFVFIIVALACLFYIAWQSRRKQYNRRRSIVTHSNIGLRGDMGNQMFQLACLWSAASRSNCDYVIPDRVKKLPIVSLFKLDEEPYTAGFIETDVIRETKNEDIIHIPADGGAYDIRGYRQALSYFSDNEDEIKSKLRIRRPLVKSVKGALPKRYIAIHVRLGDYNKTIHKIPMLREFRRCKKEYYSASYSLMRKRYPDLPCIVCTNDVPGAKALLPFLVTNVMWSPKVDDVDGKLSDFIIMSRAKALAISNSTYSWWASYLNKRATVKVFPCPWWDPDGVIGGAMGLHGPFLYPEDVILLNTDTGKDEVLPDDRSNRALGLWGMVRGIVT